MQGLNAKCCLKVMKDMSIALQSRHLGFNFKVPQ